MVVDCDTFKREFFSVSNSMQQLLHRTLLPICQSHGLTLQQLHVLVELTHTPDLTAGELSERAGILRTNFSGVCQKMEKRGLIERNRSERDGRSYELRATQAGRELLEQLNADIEKRYGQALEVEPDETFDTIIAGFKAMRDFAQRMEA